MNDTTNTPDNIEGVMRRVAKLLAIAGDERANPAEAAAAAGQAEKIMRKFQLEHADVIGAAMKRDDSFDQRDVGGTMNPDARAKSTTSWAGMLSLAIGRLNDCHTIWSRNKQHGTCIRYSGYKSDTQVAVWTHLYVVNALTMSLRQFQRTNGAGRGASEAFRMGYIVAVVSSLERALADKQAEMQGEVASRALVVVKADAVAERFGRQQVKNHKYSQGGGYSDGHAAGSRLDIGRRGVNTNTAAVRLS